MKGLDPSDSPYVTALRALCIEHPFLFGASMVVIATAAFVAITLFLGAA